MEKLQGLSKEVKGAVSILLDKFLRTMTKINGTARKIVIQFKAFVYRLEQIENMTTHNQKELDVIGRWIATKLAEVCGSNVLDEFVDQLESLQREAEEMKKNMPPEATVEVEIQTNSLKRAVILGSAFALASLSTPIVSALSFATSLAAAAGVGVTAGAATVVSTKFVSHNTYGNLLETVKERSSEVEQIVQDLKDHVFQVKQDVDALQASLDSIQQAEATHMDVYLVLLAQKDLHAFLKAMKEHSPIVLAAAEQVMQSTTSAKKRALEAHEDSDFVLIPLPLEENEQAPVERNEEAPGEGNE